MTPVTKIMWFKRHEPALAARVRWWAGRKDVVVAALTGTLATEPSSTSGTAMLDQSTSDRTPTAVDLAGIRRDHRPRVLSAGCSAAP